MDATYQLIVTEAIGFMRSALARDKPEDAKSLVAAALADMKASESPAGPQHIGERSAVRVPLEQAATCIMDGKGFAARWPDAANALPAPALAAFEEALAAGAPPAKKRAARPHG